MRASQSDASPDEVVALGFPDKVTFHQLRHAFASRAHARGVTLQDLSMVMGHSSKAVTEKVYIHLYGREQAEERFRTAMAGVSSGR